MYSRINCCCLDIQPELAVCSVVVHIHNGIQASCFCVSHDFCDSIEPRLFYLIIRSFSYMSEPSDRNTYCGESCCLYLVECGLRSFRVAPESLSGYAVVLSIEVVAEVPADSELRGRFPCSIILRHRHYRSRFRLHNFSALADFHILLFLSGYDRYPGRPFLDIRIRRNGYSDNSFVSRISCSFLHLHPAVARNDIKLF